MMIRLKDTPTSGFYLFEVNSLIKKSLLLQLVAFKIYAIIKTFYCSNWLPMVSGFFETISPNENINSGINFDCKKFSRSKYIFRKDHGQKLCDIFFLPFFQFFRKMSIKVGTIKIML